MDIGYRMSGLPVEPMLAKTILVSGALQCSKEALLVAASISTNDWIWLDQTWAR
jgi:HrpA-like RNA helicase